MVNRKTRVVNTARRTGTVVNPGPRGLIGHGGGGFGPFVQRPCGGLGHCPDQGVAGVGPVRSETGGAGGAASGHGAHAGGPGARRPGPAGLRIGVARPPRAPVGPPPYIEPPVDWETGQSGLDPAVVAGEAVDARKQYQRHVKKTLKQIATNPGMPVDDIGQYVDPFNDVHHRGLFRGSAASIIIGVAVGLLMVISGIWWFRPAGPRGAGVAALTVPADVGTLAERASPQGSPGATAAMARPEETSQSAGH